MLIWQGLTCDGGKRCDTSIIRSWGISTDNFIHRGGTKKKVALVHTEFFGGDVQRLSTSQVRFVKTRRRVESSKYWGSFAWQRVRCGVRKNAMVTGSVDECMAVGGRPGGADHTRAKEIERERW
jgi:hypothetical protein